MLKGLGNIANMLKQAQEMQGRMSEAQEKLSNLTVDGVAGGGMVSVTANGQQKVLSIRVEESVMDDREMLEDLLVAAVNQALDKTRQQAGEEMKKVTGDVELPGLDEALSKLGLGGSGS